MLSAERRKKVSFMFAGCLLVWLAGQVDVLFASWLSGCVGCSVGEREISPVFYTTTATPPPPLLSFHALIPNHIDRLHAEQGKHSHHADSIAVVSIILRDIRAEPEDVA